MSVWELKNEYEDKLFSTLSDNIKKQNTANMLIERCNKYNERKEKIQVEFRNEHTNLAIEIRQFLNLELNMMYSDELKRYLEELKKQEEKIIKEIKNERYELQKYINELKK